MPTVHRAALAQLGSRRWSRASIAPGRQHATAPAVLFEHLVRGCPDRARVEAFAGAFGSVVRALEESFPENIFWDLDHLASHLWSFADADAMSDLARLVVSVCCGYGIDSNIRFRYAHDFLYGYDWARWVRKCPEERRGVGPFDLAFFAYLEGRRAELADLVDRDDAQFHRLAQGEFRNPFCFVREPHEERELHAILADVGLVPVKAWRLDGPRRWDLPFTELRAQIAERLGFSKRLVQ